jgi:hypothetical protein
MISGKPKTTKYNDERVIEKSKSSSLDPFNNLLSLYPTGGNINEDSQSSRFEVPLITKINQHLGIPA